MFRPLEIFVGLRYIRARRSNRFVSFISLASTAGVAIGVAALIVVISVMNGFENELRERLLSLSAHATITAADGTLHGWEKIGRAAEQTPGIVAAAPFVQFDAMLGFGPNLSGARLKGVLPGAEERVSSVAEHMREGSFDDLVPGGDRIILGRILAMVLGVRTGDGVIALIPRGGAAGGRLNPRLKRFVVSGIFEVGLQDHDGVLAYIHLSDAAALSGIGDAVDGLRLRFGDVFAAPRGVREFVTSQGGDLKSSDWTRENASYFRAIRIEKTMMSLMLMLVVAVAAFNIVSTLVMVVTEKKTDIAILRTLGLDPSSVVRIFLVQGTLLGWIGALLGVALGVYLAVNVGEILPAIESFFGFELFPSSVYYISDLPSDLHRADVVWIALSSLVLTALATLYPAWQAARVQPAEALRYE
jgi:lipoprotein-releasing system permease protein